MMKSQVGLKSGSGRVGGDKVECLRMHYSTRVAAIPRATASSAPMLHVNVIAALQSTRALVPESSEMHRPDVPTPARCVPEHAVPLKIVAVQPSDGLHVAN